MTYMFFTSVCKLLTTTVDDWRRATALCRGPFILLIHHGRAGGFWVARTKRTHHIHTHTHTHSITQTPHSAGSGSGNRLGVVVVREQKRVNIPQNPKLNVPRKVSGTFRPFATLMMTKSHNPQSMKCR